MFAINYNYTYLQHIELELHPFFHVFSVLDNLQHHRYNVVLLKLVCVLNSFFVTEQDGDVSVSLMTIVKQY